MSATSSAATTGLTKEVPMKIIFGQNISQTRCQLSKGLSENRGSFIQEPDWWTNLIRVF